MNNNLRVGSLFGIPFFVNPSWFVVLALVTWSYGSGLAGQFPSLGGSAWVLGFVAALLLFSSVLAHELGHSFVARQQGIAVNSITLFIFGGLATLAEESKTPGQAFRVAIAGPLVSIVLFGALTALNIAVALPAPLAAIVGLLSYINLALALFNLIPGLPLDGGNVLKAIVWKITGKPYKGIAFASVVGQIIGWAAIGLGLASILGITRFGSFWTLLVGWFLLQNAQRSSQAATIQEKLTGLTAADAVAPDSPIATADSSLREFVNQNIIGRDLPWTKFLVVDAEGKLTGELSLDALKTIPTNEWWNVTVGELAQPIAQLETVASDKPLLDVIALLEEKKVPVLAVIRENGALVGLLEKTSIAQRLAEIKPA